MYLFYGEEKYDLNKEVEKIKSGFDNLSLGLNLFYITKDNINELSNICDNVTFFGESKLVILKDTNLKFDIDRITNYLNPSTTLVIIEDNVDKRTSEYKKISSVANVVEFKYLDSKEMLSYITKILKQYEINISQADAEYFVNMCGDDKQNNINELNKIVSYVGKGGIVNKEIIDKVCVKTFNSKIFDMLNDIVNKKTSEALIELDQLLMLKEPIVKIYIMLYKQVKQMYLIKCLKQKNETDIAKKLEIHPFVFKNLSYASDKYTLTGLRKIIKMFDNYDEKTKNGELDFEIGLKELICSM
jgi:DNA polymerase-3 subunit delta